MDLLRNGSSLEEVKKVLGVKSIKMCHAYQAVVANEIKDFYKSDRFEKKVRLLRRENRETLNARLNMTSADR